MTKQYVYVDTNIYNQYKFDVIKSPLQQLTDKQLFIILCSDITKGEILKHHNKMLEEDIEFKCPDSFLHLLHKKRNITLFPDLDLRELASLSIKDIDKADKSTNKSIDNILIDSIKNRKHKENELITQTILDNQGVIIPPYYQNSIPSTIYFLINSMKLQSKEYLKYYLDNECEFVDCYKVDPKLIFNSHFNLHPPFSSKKPKEFKDAYVLFSLLEYAKENNTTISIISNDSDWEDFVKYGENKKHLIYYKKLPDFLYGEEVSYKIAKIYTQDLIKHANNYLIHNLRGYIENHNIDSSYEENHGMINLLEEINWNIEDISLKEGDIEKIENESKTTYKATIHINANILVLDDDALYDSGGCLEVSIHKTKWKEKVELMITISNNKITRVVSDCLQYLIDNYDQECSDYMRGK